MDTIDNRAQSWTKLYKLNKSLLRKPPPVHPLIDSDGNLQYDTQVKANIFAGSLVYQFKISPSQSWVDEVVHENIDFHDNLLYNKAMFFTPEEIWNAIKINLNRYAPGPDGISNCTLKHCRNKIITTLSRILNNCLRLEYFPPVWKEAARPQ